MRNCWSLLLIISFAFSTSAKAVEFSFDGYVDVRLVLPSGEKSWIDGGVGKFRFGGQQPSPNFRFTEAVGQVSAAITPDIHGVVVARIEPEQRSGVDLLETYFAWRPEAAGDLRWSMKTGAFFPPISLENDDIGWTSPYTLTPSAINSWVGDELRTIGGEGTLEWRGPAGTLRASGALFCCNEPAGNLIAKRGWSLDDRPTGLFERVNTPETDPYFAFPLGIAMPEFAQRRGLFENIDGHVGWYGGLNWSMPNLGEARILYYDNEANPAAFSLRDTSWRTHFWATSYRGRFLGATILAQGMTGQTAIGAAPSSVTYFDSAYLLASYDIDDWRLSGRAETFEARNSSATEDSEDGHAITAAVSWNARSWLRVTSELIELSSRRGEPAFDGRVSSRDDRQFQLNGRIFL